MNRVAELKTASIGLGASEEIRTKMFIVPTNLNGFNTMDIKINRWLDDNPVLEIIDIKFSSTAAYGVSNTEALVIYKTK